MNSIYIQKPQIKQSLFNKLFGILPKENATIEINNILASINIIDVKAEQINDVFTKYKVGNNSKFKNSLYDIYKAFLKHCLNDKVLTEQESFELKHLKSILGLTDYDANRMFNELAEEIYKKSFNEVISDGIVDNSEKELLEKMKSNLCLSDEIAAKIEKESKQKFISTFLDTAVSDRRLSPDEINEYEALCKNLDIQVNMDNQTMAIWDKYKLYWIVENGDIPEIEVSIALQKAEKCYFKTHTDLLEFRTVTQRINYSGVTYRVKIAKGLYYRVGSIKPQRITSEHLVNIDSGTLYLTNKRLIFVGLRKNSTIKIDKILSVTPYSDGVEIIKDSGKNPVYKFNADSELFTMILTRLINE